MSVKNRNSIVTDGLVFYVDAGNDLSYPETGTTWTDLIDGDTSTLTNGPTFVSDNGGGIVCDGSNDYVALPTDVVPSSTAATISFVAKNNYSTLTTNKGVFAINGSTKLYLYLGSAGSGGTHGRIGAYNASSYAFPSPNVNTFPVGETHEFTMVIDSGNFLFYKDGVHQQTVTSISFTASGATSLGIYPTGTNNGNFTFYNTKIYNKALSASEVLQNYNALKNRFI